MRLFHFSLLLLIVPIIAGCDNHSSPQRYQMVSNPQMTDTYLLDNQKGRIWQLTTSTDVPGHPEVWEEMDIIDNKGEIGMTSSAYLKLHAADTNNHGHFVPDVPPGADAEKGKFDFSNAKPSAQEMIPDWAKGVPKTKLVDPNEKGQPNSVPAANTGGDK